MPEETKKIGHPSHIFWANSRAFCVSPAARPLPSCNNQVYSSISWEHPGDLLSSLGPIKEVKAEKVKTVAELPCLLNAEAEVWAQMTGPFEELMGTWSCQ